MLSFRSSRRLMMVAAVALSSWTGMSAQAGLATKLAPGGADYDALMAKASSQYYSSTKAGLAGFDCQVHPDWEELFLSANKGASLSDAQQQRVQLLKTVSVTLHGRMGGNSSLDWTNPSTAGLDTDTISMLNQMQGATEQTLTGFMQFWGPFFDGTVLPSNAQGLTIDHANGAYTIRTSGGGTTVTMTLTDQLLLQEYDVLMPDQTSTKFQPSYRATAQGLMVEHFQAYIQKMTNPPGPAQELNVGVEYQTVSGLTIPAKLNMEVVGTGVFNFMLDGCTVTRK